MQAIVGASQAVITPPGPMLLNELDREFTSVEADLFLRCLVVQGGETTAVLLVYDLIGFNSDFVARLKGRLQARFGLDSMSVMIVTTQNHAAPRTLWEDGVSRDDPASVSYFALLEQRTHEAVERALDAARPARLGFGRGRVEGLAGNRRPTSVDGRTIMTWDRPPGDRIADWGLESPLMEVARFDHEDGRPVAVLFHFTSHPNVLWTTGVISPDFPGLASEQLRAAIGPSVVPIFLNGFCGDIDPFKYMNVPREGFCKPWALQPEHSDKVRLCLDESRRFGRLLGDELIRVVRGVVCEEPVGVPASGMSRVRGRPRSLRRYGCPEHIEVHALRLSQELALLGVPLEPFFAIELEIERRSPFAHTFCVQSANGYHGYLPSTPEYARGGFGTGPSMCYFEPGTDNELIETSAQLLGSLHAQPARVS